MDVSELRQGILRALEAARKAAADKRTNVDEARAVWEAFLRDVAVPLFRQAADVLKAERQLYTAQTPADSVRLVADHSAETFIELELDTSGAHPQVVGRISVSRGRGGHVLEETAIGEGATVKALTERDVSEFLLHAIPRLIVR